MEMEAPNQMIQLEANGLGTSQAPQLFDRGCRPTSARVGVGYALQQQQRFDTTLGGRQLLHVGITQLHQVAQLAIGARGNMNAAELPSAQSFGEAQIRIPKRIEDQRPKTGSTGDL